MYSEDLELIEGSSFEKWLWIELIGFDNKKNDYGVKEFLNNIGFTPDAVSFLIMNPDFIHTHDGIKEEKIFPPDYCSYGGRPRSRERFRQEWTNYQLQGLIHELHKYRIEVYCSFFNFADILIDGNISKGEWSGNHPELFEMKRNGEKYPLINPLRRFEDMTYYEDFLIEKLVEVLNDYGFDGFHGADGYTSLRMPLAEVDYSDDMVDQFVEMMQIDLPSDIERICEGLPDKIEQRAAWIIKNKRVEWIRFYANRTEGLWRKIADTLHKEGIKVYFNTVWTKDPFEALYRYGVDYRRIAEAGVDGFIVETVEPVLALGGYDGESDSSHYSFMAMLMLIKAYISEAKLMFLNAVRDTCEQWDVIHHAPTLLEKEIYCISNLYNYSLSGKLEHCAEGPVVCLSDSIRYEEWKWLREKWKLGFSLKPQSIEGITLVWSNAAFENQLEDFVQTRRWSTHKIVHELMSRGVPIRAVTNINYVEKVKGAILVTNQHLLPEDELKRVLEYSNGPVIMIGEKSSVGLSPDFQFGDVYTPNELFCEGYRTGQILDFNIQKEAEESLPLDIKDIRDPDTWLKELYFRKVSENFLQNCVRIISDCTGAPKVVSQSDSIKVASFDIGDSNYRILIENDSFYYVTPKIDMGREIEYITVMTDFPLLTVKPEGSIFSVKVPGRGAVVLEMKAK